MNPRHTTKICRTLADGCVAAYGVKCTTKTRDIKAVPDFYNITVQTLDSHVDALHGNFGLMIKGGKVVVKIDI